MLSGGSLSRSPPTHVESTVMIGRARAGRDAEEFAALIEGRPTGRTPSIELAALADLVGAVQRVEPLRPRPEFAESLRAQLLLEAPEHLTQPAESTAGDSGRTETVGSRTRLKLRLARVAAVTCLIVGVTGGIAAASQSALPGDPLYGVKRGIERVQVSLAGSDETQGQRLVSQAATRLDEVNDLAVTRPDDPQTVRLIQQTLDEFDKQADDGAAALIESYSSTSAEDSIARLRQFTGASASDLDHLSSVVPAPARGDLLDTARLLSDLDQQARDVCSDCSSLAPLELSDTVQQLADATRDVIDLPSAVPDNDPGGTPRSRGNDQKPDGTPAQEPPSGLLPSLPALTQAAPPADGSNQSGGGSSQQGGNGGGNGGSGGGQTSKPPEVLPDLPLPQLPLPSLPLLGDLGGLLGGTQSGE